MKHFLLILGFTGTIVACNSNETSSEASHEEAVATVQDSSISAKAFDAYLELSNALIKSDASSAQSAGTHLKNEVIALNDSTLSLTTSYIDSLTASNEIEIQRIHFQHISEAWYNYLKASGAGRTVYKQFCPMAFKNKGGYWISDKKDILNPYFGDAMLKCGRVDESF